MPEEEIDLSTSEEKGWLGKIKDSIYQNWQTLLVALIVLIVGISAYNYNNDKTGTDSTDQAVQEENADQQETEDTAKEQEEYVEEKDQEAAQEQQQETAAPTATEQQETKTAEIETNTVENNGDGYTVTADKGEGITHLARKALDKYLSENDDSEITALHKIYIEDYLQNRIGSQGIEIGHEETITKKSIEEAIAASKKLSQVQLDNLKKYQTK